MELKIHIIVLISKQNTVTNVLNPKHFVNKKTCNFLKI